MQPHQFITKNRSD